MNSMLFVATLSVVLLLILYGLFRIFVEVLYNIISKKENEKERRKATRAEAERIAAERLRFNRIIEICTLDPDKF